MALRTILSTESGISLRYEDGNGGSTFVIWYIIEKLLEAWNGSRPVSNWYITTPRE